MPKKVGGLGQFADLGWGLARKRGVAFLRGVCLPQCTLCKTNRYGEYSITVSAIESWNKIQKQLKNMLLKDLSPNKIKTVVSNFYCKSC